MKLGVYPTGFDVDAFLRTETPTVAGLFNDSTEAYADLKSLFSFPVANRDAMPFYVVNEAEAQHVAEVAERAYGAMYEALEWLAKNQRYIPRFYGEAFCRKYPEFIDYALWTFEQGHEAMYGRFDMAMDSVTGQVTGVYEFNGNTPVMLFESVILQTWLLGKVNQQVTHKTFDESNSYYSALTESLPKILKYDSGKAVIGVLLNSEFIEDAVACETLFQIFDNSDQCEAYIDHIDNVEYNLLADAGTPWEVAGVPVNNLFVLQPWEEIVESCYDDVITRWHKWGPKTRFFEPAWRWFMSNKGILALVTHLLETDAGFAERHGDLPFLRTYMEPTRLKGGSYVSKPLVGRLSNNITIYNADGTVQFASGGSYSDLECIYQEYCSPDQVEGRNNFIVGQWMAPYADTPEPHYMQAACLCFREFDNPVLSIKNERFIPHLVELSNG